MHARASTRRRRSIVAWGEHRLARSPEEELATPLLDIAKIAHLRLDDLLAAG